MFRFSLAQFTSFTIACAVYFGAMPVMCIRLRTIGGNEIDSVFIFMAAISWLTLAAIYAWWRQMTPLAVQILMPLSILPLGILMLLFDDEVQITMLDVAKAIVGPGCWAGVMFSFPVSLILLVLSAFRGKPTDPVTTSVARQIASFRSWWNSGSGKWKNLTGTTGRPKSRAAKRKRNHPAEFFFAAAIAAFVLLFLFAGVYNAITLKPAEEWTPSGQRIVWLLSFLDDGDQSLYLFGDFRYTATLIGVPVVLAAIGLGLHLWRRPSLDQPDSG
jgi:hypothetical protein